MDVWEDVLKTATNRPVGEFAVSVLRGVAKQDVEDSIAALDGCSRRIWQRWAEWYPYWARDTLKRALAQRPWLMLDAETKKARKREQTAKRVASKRMRSLLERVIEVMPEGPMRFNDLALGLFGKKNCTDKNKAVLWDLIESQQYACLGVVQGFDKQPFIVWRWKPDVRLEEWWRVHPLFGDFGQVEADRA